MGFGLFVFFSSTAFLRLRPSRLFVLFSFCVVHSYAVHNRGAFVLLYFYILSWFFSTRVRPLERFGACMYYMYALDDM